MVWLWKFRKNNFDDLTREMIGDKFLSGLFIARNTAHFAEHLLSGGALARRQFGTMEAN